MSLCSFLMKDFENVAKFVVDDILANLEEETKVELREANLDNTHFGFGLFVRNKYVHNPKTRIEQYADVIDADGFSAEVVKRVKFHLCGGQDKAKVTTKKELLEMLERYPDDTQIVLKIGYSETDAYHQEQRVGVQERDKQLLIFDLSGQEGE